MTNDKAVAYSRNVFAENAALNIARHSSAALNMQEKEVLRRKFGPPNALVNLPNGTQFDTRQLRGSNQHAKNNNLPVGEENPITHSSGMESNLKPEDDWLAAFDRQCSIMKALLQSATSCGYGKF